MQKKWKNILCKTSDVFLTNEFLWDCTNPSGPVAPEYGFWLTEAQFGNCDWGVGRDEKENINYISIDNKKQDFAYIAIFIDKHRIYTNENECVGIYANKITAINFAMEHAEYLIKKYNISIKMFGDSFRKVSYQLFVYPVDVKISVYDFEKNRININEWYYYPKYTEDLTSDVFSKVKNRR